MVAAITKANVIEPPVRHLRIYVFKYESSISMLITITKNDRMYNPFALWKSEMVTWMWILCYSVTISEKYQLIYGDKN